jgi:hypothetical protein
VREPQKIEGIRFLAPLLDNIARRESPKGNETGFRGFSFQPEFAEPLAQHPLKLLRIWMLRWCFRNGVDRLNTSNWFDAIVHIVGRNPKKST